MLGSQDRLSFQVLAQKVHSLQFTARRDFTAFTCKMRGLNGILKQKKKR